MDEEEEFKTTAYANASFAFNEEKMQRESTSDDVRSTDIEDSMTASAVTDSLPPMSRSTSLRSGVSRA